jgi:hypothetical protein
VIDHVVTGAELQEALRRGTVLTSLARHNIFLPEKAFEHLVINIQIYRRIIQHGIISGNNKSLAESLSDEAAAALIEGGGLEIRIAEFQRMLSEAKTMNWDDGVIRYQKGLNALLDLKKALETARPYLAPLHIPQPDVGWRQYVVPCVENFLDVISEYYDGSLPKTQSGAIVGYAVIVIKIIHGEEIRDGAAYQYLLKSLPIWSS